METWFAGSFSMWTPRMSSVSYFMELTIFCGTLIVRMQTFLGLSSSKRIFQTNLFDKLFTVSQLNCNPVTDMEGCFELMEYSVKIVPFHLKF